jgi:hypothetical protein
MTLSPDLASICGTQLEGLGFELLDLGRDYEEYIHFYYIFDAVSGEQVTDELLSLEEVQDFIASSSRSAHQPSPILRPWAGNG